MLVKEIKAEIKRITGKPAPALRKKELQAFLDGLIAEYTAIIGEGKEINLANAIAASYVDKSKRQIKVKYSDVKRIPFEETSLPNLKEKLERDGYAVVKLDYPNDWALSEFDRWLAAYHDKCGYSEEKRNKQSSLPDSTRGIFKHWLAHLEFQWVIRLACKPVFAEIFDTDDLICSYDGGSILYPNEKEVFEAWFHNDMPRVLTNPRILTGEPVEGNFTCYQGVVHLTDSYSGGLTMIEGSHKRWEEYNSIHLSEGYKWEKCDTRFYSGADIISVDCPAGHMILFDSKMAHCNSPPHSEFFKSFSKSMDLEMEREKRRLVTYVSMAPRSMLTPDEIAKKIKYYEENRMTSHWCFGPYFSANAANPRVFNADPKVYPDPEHYLVTDDMTSMIGY
jgi:hypothetical protein